MPSKDPASVLPRFVRVLFLAVPILGIFVGTAFGVAQIVAWWTGHPATSATGIYLGIICGLAIWLFIAVFHIKKEIILLPFQDREELMTGLKAQLEELGYESTDQGDAEVVFRPSFQAFLFGGGIRVQMEDNSAKIVGPKVYLERLRHGLRMKSHLSKVQKTYRDARTRPAVPVPAPTGTLLRSVRINGRFTAEQLRGLYAEVVQPLTRDGGEVACEVQLSAQAEPGIHTSTVENVVRRWLEQQHIVAEIQTEPVAPPAAAPSQSAEEAIHPA